MTETFTWQGICPDCKSLIGELVCPANAKTCPRCLTSYPVIQDIYRLITEKRLQHYAKFLDEYTRIRHAERRSSHSADYYFRLPIPNKSDPLAWQWRIRNITYQWFISKILSQFNRTLKIVDVGAGVGWLSYRLAENGHHPVAVDLTIDPMDGLSASSFYGGSWPRVQAEFDHLPFVDNQADMVIYNASLHYSINYLDTLREALRVLSSDGMIVILDSPVYNNAASGEQMKAERHNQFEQQYGFRSDSIRSIEYLTWDMLNKMGVELGLKWRIIKPWYGWSWALRPITARLRGKREPSRFAIIIGTLTTQELT